MIKRLVNVTLNIPHKFYHHIKHKQTSQVRCSMCGEQFCLEHRSAEFHSCVKLVKQVNPALKENPTTAPTYKVPKKIKYKSKKQEKLAAKAWICENIV